MNKNEIGKRIKEIRIALGLSMTKFGEKIDKDSPVKSGVVSNWENGKQIPNNERVKKIAELGNITSNELLYGSEFTYEDIEKNITTKKLETEISEKLMLFLKNYLFYSEYNYYSDKAYHLLNLFIDDLDINIETIIQKIYHLISDKKFSFYQHGVFVLLNEDFTKLHIQLYLTEYIYNLLVQISLEYPDIYYKNLLLQIDETKENIQDVSRKKDIYTDDKLKFHLSEFIDPNEYLKIFDELDKLKEQIDSKDIIKSDFRK